MNIDLKKKLSSRKFWAMLGGQITAILTAFNASDSLVLQTSAVIASIGIIAVYILAEAYVDSKREGSVDFKTESIVNETALVSYKPIGSASGEGSGD